MNKTLKGIMSRVVGSERSIASITAPIGVMQADLQKFAGEKLQRLQAIEDEIDALVAERLAIEVQADRAACIADKLGAFL